MPDKNKPIRCAWALSDPLYTRYHDREWGYPVHDDTKLFEMLILEGFQAGLSWITILRKRNRFAQAFAQWDYHSVAKFDKKDVERLMNDAGIIRNRKKIEAAIANAHAFISIRKQFGSFDNYIWRFTDGTTISPKKRVRTFDRLPTHSPESVAMSKDLKKRGFRFVGPITCYAFMQAVGMVDDHLEGCFRIDSHLRETGYRSHTAIDR